MIWLFLFLFLGLTEASSPLVSALQETRLLSLSTVDHKAVLQRADGELELLVPGDRIDGTRLVVVEILPDRLLLQEVIAQDAADGERPRKVWLFRADGAGASRARVLDPNPPSPDRVAKPRLREIRSEPPADGPRSSPPPLPSPASHDLAPDAEAEGDGG